MAYKLYNCNLGIIVTGWNRFLKIQTIFKKASDKQLDATPASGSDDWAIWLSYRAEGKLSPAAIDNYRNFLRGALAASYEYDPLQTEEASDGR